MGATGRIALFFLLALRKMSVLAWVNQNTVVSSSSTSSTHPVIPISSTNGDIVQLGKTPEASTHARARKLSVTAPKCTRSLRKPKGPGNLKNLPASERVAEFPGHWLSVTACKALFCGCCRNEVVKKNTILPGHLNSKKHCVAKATHAEKQKRAEPLIDK